VGRNLARFLLCLTLAEGIECEGKKTGLYNSLEKVDVSVRNDQMLGVTALKFESQISSGVASNPRLSGR